MVMTFDGEISGKRAEYLQCIRIVVIIYSADEHEYIFCQKNHSFPNSPISTHMIFFNISIKYRVKQTLTLSTCI